MFNSPFWREADSLEPKKYLADMLNVPVLLPSRQGDPRISIRIRPTFQCAGQILKREDGSGRPGSLVSNAQISFFIQRWALDDFALLMYISLKVPTSGLPWCGCQYIGLVLLRATLTTCTSPGTTPATGTKPVALSTCGSAAPSVQRRRIAGSSNLRLGIYRFH